MTALTWLVKRGAGCVATCVATGVMVVLVAGLAYGAQSGSAELHGFVQDDTGAGVPGASVTLTNGRQTPLSTTTDATGAYVLREVPAGRYTLVVLLQGFKPTSQQIDLPARLVARLDLKLRLAIEERVEVVSSLDELKRVTGLSPVGMTLGPDQLGALPNDPEIMLQVLRELSATSGRADEVKVYVDGQPVSARLPPKEAIQSIRISTNSFASEFAEPSAGLVEIVTKPASTRFRGETQATFNDSRLNAQNFFEPRSGRAERKRIQVSGRADRPRALEFPRLRRPLDARRPDRRQHDDRRSGDLCDPAVRPEHPDA